MIDCSKTENYFKEKGRMVGKMKLKNGLYVCTIKCRDCPLSNFNNEASENMSCADFEMVYPKNAERVLNALNAGIRRLTNNSCFFTKIKKSNITIANLK